MGWKHPRLSHLHLFYYLRHILYLQSINNLDFLCLLIYSLGLLRRPKDGESKIFRLMIGTLKRCWMFWFSNQSQLNQYWLFLEIQKTTQLTKSESACPCVSTSPGKLASGGRFGLKSKREKEMWRRRRKAEERSRQEIQKIRLDDTSLSWKESGSGCVWMGSGVRRFADRAYLSLSIDIFSWGVLGLFIQFILFFWTSYPLKAVTNHGWLAGKILSDLAPLPLPQLNAFNLGHGSLLAIVLPMSRSGQRSHLHLLKSQSGSQSTKVLYNSCPRRVSSFFKCQ